MPLTIQKKQLNISPRRTVLTNYGGNSSETKRADRDVKIHRDFRIRSHNHLLQQIANFVATLEYIRRREVVGQIARSYLTCLRIALS
jgi:hypothetical protein